MVLVRRVLVVWLTLIAAGDRRLLLGTPNNLLSRQLATVLRRSYAASRISYLAGTAAVACQAPQPATSSIFDQNFRGKRNWPSVGALRLKMRPQAA